MLSSSLHDQVPEHLVVRVARLQVLDRGELFRPRLDCAFSASFARSAHRRAASAPTARAHLHRGARDLQRLGRLAASPRSSGRSSPP